MQVRIGDKRMMRFRYRVRIFVFAVTLTPLSMFDSRERTGDGIDFRLIPLASAGVPGKYGRRSESCTTKGIVVKSNDNWKQILQSAKPGETVLLRAGIFEVTDTIRLPNGSANKPIVIKPYNCESATIYGDGESVGRGVLMYPGSYNTIAGLHIESATHEKLTDIAGSVRDIEFRNNSLYGGRNDAITIRGGVKNIAFKGNDINSGPGQRAGITGSTGGHIFSITFKGSAVPDGVDIIRNQIRGSYFGDLLAGDDTIAISAGNNIVIEENWFTQNYNIEQIIDIKSRLSSVPVIIRGNLFENNFLGTHGGQDGPNPPDAPEIIVGDFGSASSLRRHVIEYNRFERGISLGASSRSASALISNNIIDAQRISRPTIVFGRVYNTVVSNNTFYRGGFKIGRYNSCIIPNGGLVFKNNIFYETYIMDQTQRCPANRVIVAYNVFHRLGSSFTGAAKYVYNTSVDPGFVNVAKGDFRLKSNSPALTAGERGNETGAPL